MCSQLNKLTCKIKVVLLPYTHRESRFPIQDIQWVLMCIHYKNSLSEQDTLKSLTIDLYCTFIALVNLFIWTTYYCVKHITIFLELLCFFYKIQLCIDSCQFTSALNLITTHWNPPFSFSHSFIYCNFYCVCKCIQMTPILEVRELLKEMKCQNTRN